MKTFLLNDTSDYHCGSAAVIGAIHEKWKDMGWEIIGQARSRKVANTRVKKDEHCPFYDPSLELLLINGEGTLWGQNHKPAVVEIMRLAKYCLDQGKKVVLFNAQWEVWNDDIFAATLLRMHFIYARENRSKERLLALGIDPKRLAVAPDFCLAKEIEKSSFNYTTKKFVVGKSYRLPIGRGSKEIPLVKWMNKPEFQVPLTKADRWSDIVHTLKGCGGYVTGQHHGVYAGLSANIPVIAVPTMNSKLEALIELLAEYGWTVPMAHNAEEIHHYIETVDEWFVSGEKALDACHISLLSTLWKMKEALK